MSALLRRSTGIARVAGYSLSQTGLRSTRVLRNTSPRAALAASAASSARHQQSLRFYSNKGDGKDKSDEIKKSEKGPASDTEAKAEGAASPKDEEKPLPEGWVHLSEDDLKVFESFKNSNMLPWVSNKDKALLDGIKKTGVPVDLRDIMHRWRSGSPSLADTGKLLKGINTLAKRMAEEEVMQNINPDRQSEAYRNAGTKKATEKKTEQDMETETERGTEKASSQKQGEEAEKSKTEEEPKIDFRPNDPSKDGHNESQGSQGNRKRPPPSEFKSPDMVTTIVGCAVAWWLYSSMFDESGREITWQDLRKNFLDKGLVEKLAVTGRKVRVYLNKEATQSMYPDSVAVRPGFHYYFSIGSVDSFERHLDDAQEELGIPAGERIPVSYVGDSMLFGLVATLGPTLLFFGLLMWMQRRGPGGGGSSGIFGMGKSRAKRFNHEASVKTKFSDVAGMDEAKQEILEFVSFLQKPEKFKKLGAKIPRGAILAGPPGTGKTMIAKATAGESGVPFFSVSGSEFVEMFVGVGASRVRDLFAEARKSAPCIVFIDEIDAIGKARSEGKGFSGGHDEREATLNQILTEMDGFNTTEQVVVLAGTNRVDILDKALMRPGRFDRHINIDMPTMAGRQDIFKVYLPKIKTHEEIEYLSGRLATLTPGFAGADIANCVNEAALIAARHDASAVTLKHFELAIERVIGGLERKSLVLNPQERKVVAYHEAGHAICGWYFQFADPLLKVSIIPRGKGLGYAQYLPADAYLMNSSQLMDRMAMTLGGRISEELHFETVTTGGSDDFDKVTRMATSMVTQWGMSDKLGTINYSKDNNDFNKPYAETTGQVIDAEIKRIVAEAYKQCKDLLVEKKKEVGIVAEELLSKEVLVRDDMIRLLGPRPFDDRDASFNKYFGGKQPVDVDGGGAPDVDQPPPGGDTPAPNPAMFKAIQDKDTTR